MLRFVSYLFGGTKTNNKSSSPAASCTCNSRSSDGTKSQRLCPHSAINQTDIFGNTPLHIACLTIAAKDVDAAKKCTDLLASGSDVNAENVHGEMALHMAARRGLVITAKVLLDNGAVIYHRDNFGNTPADEGHQCKFRDIMDPFFAKCGRERVAPLQHLCKQRIQSHLSSAQHADRVENLPLPTTIKRWVGGPFYEENLPHIKERQAAEATMPVPLQKSVMAAFSWRLASWVS